MGIKINQNIVSLLIQRNLDRITKRLNTSLDRLSSGERIRRSSDDPAGLSSSQQIRFEIRGLQRNQLNISGALSLVATAETGFNNLTSSIQRIRELLVQAANDTLSPSDRSLIENEVGSLLEEINRTASETSYLGRNLLDGTITNQNIQVGTLSGQGFGVTIDDFRTAVLGQVAKATGVNPVSASPLLSGLLSINGITVPASSGDGISFFAANASAIAKAAAINSVQAQTGVEAIAEAATMTGDPSGSIGPATIDGTTSSLTINGVPLPPVVVLNNDSDGALASAINAISDQSGVTATVDAGGILTLTAKDGRNITLNSTGTLATTLGFVTGTGDFVNETATGSITLRSNDPITVADASPGGLAAIGFTGAQGSIGLDASTALANIQLNTAVEAGEALRGIDAALDQISEARSGLGALQNRLDSITEDLARRIEELAASDSRIRDTDFALETARLVQAQILQEVSIALLAQANSTPRTTLQLLLGR